MYFNFVSNNIAIKLFILMFTERYNKKIKKDLTYSKVSDVNIHVVPKYLIIFFNSTSIRSLLICHQIHIKIFFNLPTNK